MSQGQGIPKVQHFRYVHASFTRADLTSHAFASGTIAVEHANRHARSSKACASCTAERFYRDRMAAAVAKQPFIRRTCLRAASSSLRCH
jgi:hypothetical protein